MRKSQTVLRRQFAAYCSLCPVQIHDLAEDEKKLQRAVGCKDIKLRYNHKLGICQVWHDSPDRGLYVIFNIKDKYNLDWAIRELKNRRKSGREMAEIYLRQAERDEADFDYRNRQLAREAAELVYDHKVGKVVTSAWSR